MSQSGATIGYAAVSYPFESINLVPGGAGVASMLDGAADAVGAINLGSNTFNFYGTTYSSGTSTPGVIIASLADTSGMAAAFDRHYAAFAADIRTATLRMSSGSNGLRIKRNPS